MNIPVETATCPIGTLHVPAYVKGTRELGCGDRASHQPAILDLLTRLLSCESTVAVRTHAAQLIADYLNADFVAIGANRIRTTPCPLAVIEGSHRPSDEWRADIEASLGECSLTARMHATPTSPVDVRFVANEPKTVELPMGGALQTLSRRFSAPISLISVPLLTADQRCAGAILVASSHQAAEGHSRQSAKDFLTQVAAPLAEVILAFDRAEPSAMSRKWMSLSRVINLDHRKRAIAISLLLAVVSLFPYRFPVSAEVSVQPNVRRWIVAPFEAPLKKVHVTPGQTVKVGQLLFTIDCEDTLDQLATVRAESEKAATERSAHLSAARLSDAAIAGWNMKKLASEIDRLNKHLDRADIRSPIDGVILGDDLERLEGTPLKLGQPLVEVARIDELHLDLEIPTTRILQVSKSSEVSARIEAAGSIGELALARIHPRAEPNEQGVYVFKGRAELPVGNLDIKPGMRGTATIHGEYRPLAWCLWESLWHRLSGWS